GRKAWQFASTLSADKLSQVHNTGVNTSLLVEHAYNPIHRRYQYDPAGELVRTLDKLRGEIKYEYEANGQLRSRDTGSLVGSEEFRYDPAANRLDFNARQFDKVKDNRIKQWRDQEYRYDPWGNLIEKRSGHSKLHSFSYDCENRLVRAETLVNGKLESQGEYRYDSLGRRVAKRAEINGELEQKRFLWQGLRMLREETPGQNILYLYEPGSYAPLARVDQVEGEGQKVYYFHTDQIGTPLELTDSDGQIVWQATYRSWGALEQLVIDEVEQNLRFQGQYLDEESSLHYNTFRYYDSTGGRYISQDPIGIDGGFNLYFYAPNPFAWVDPLGWVAETAPGYFVYALYDKGAKDPYYIGITDNVTRRRGEHVASGRLNGGKMKVLDRNVTYGQARGYEQAYIEHHGTKTGVVGEAISDTNRGNKINSYDHESRTRSAARQQYFENSFNEKTSNLGGKKSMSSSIAC
ncbi:RHS repeat-associated core domain-containing protein, partial [Pseudomonas putida]|uniref:RHS repeat-associated core domain-containing protein n=1 Tax=Pseudomonas putida TaxID=303 RepID=UPI0024E0D3B2